MTKFRRLVPTFMAAAILTSCGSGLDQEGKVQRGWTPGAGVLFGEISFEGWDGPIIGGATLRVRVYATESDGAKGLLINEHIERGVNVDASQGPALHSFSTNTLPIEEGKNYIVEVHVDIDRDSVQSSGDAISVEPHLFEAKRPLDAVLIPVVRVP